jgi:hypothetical protein
MAVKARFGLGFHPAPSGGIHVDTHMLFSDEQLEALEKHLPKFFPKMSPMATLHPHPVSALERRIAEAFIVSLIQKDFGVATSIIDIGGNPDRHNRWARKSVWSLNPIIDPRDAFRNKEWKSTQWCTHKMQDYCGCATSDVFMSVHSLYYLNQDDIANALTKCTTATLYAALYTFDAPVGTLSLGEQQYRINGKGDVTCSMTGNISAYQHSACSWLSHGYYDNSTEAMSWSQVEKFGDTCVFKFVVAPCGLRRLQPRGAMELGPSIADLTYVGPISYQPLTIIGGAERQMSVKYYNEQPKFSLSTNIIIGETEPVVLPKYLLTQLKAGLAYKPRNADTFQSAVNACKNLVRKINIRDDLIEGVMLWAPVIAFSCIEAQETALAKMQWSTDFLDYNKLLTFKPDWLTRFYNQHRFKIQFAITATTAFLGYGLGYYYPSWSQMFTVAKAAQWVVTHPLEVIRAGILLGCAYPAWKTIKYFQPPPGNLFGITYPENEVYDDMCYQGTPFVPMDKTSKVKVDTTGRCKVGHGATLCGIAFAQRMPVQPRSCVHNEELAVINRTLVDLGDVASEKSEILAEWTDLTKNTFPEFWEFLKPQEFKIKKVRYNIWLTRFPLARRAAFQKAIDNEGFIEDPNYSSNKSFVKREFLLKLDDEGPYDCNPRLIQGRHELYQCHTGPWTLSFSKYLAKRWSMERESPIVYTSGMDANALGSAFDTAIKTIESRFKGKAVTFEDDAEVWDGTQNQHAIKTELHIYKLFRPSPTVLRALREQQSLKGQTPHGVKYSTKARRKSGDGNTSCGNSLLNALDHLHAIRKATGLPLKTILWNMIMFVLGDDNLIITHESFAKNLSGLEPILRRLGLRPKFKQNVDWRVSEYCSGYFYPSSIGYIYGPKIGRTLTKNAWSKMPEKVPAAWARAVALGLERDVNHIPILRVLPKVVLKLTEGVDARPYQERDPTKFKPHASKGGEAVPETYELINLLYGVDRNEIHECENIILQVSRLPARINSPKFDPYFVDIKPRGPTSTCNLLPPPNPPKFIPYTGSLWDVVAPFIKPIVDVVRNELITLYYCATVPIAPMDKVMGVLVYLTTILPYKAYQIFPTFIQPYIYVIFIGPYIEEYFKHFNRQRRHHTRLFENFSFFFILGMEAMIHTSIAISSGNPTAALRYVPTAAMHAICWWLPFRYGYPLHGLFNAFVAYYNSSLPRICPVPLGSIVDSVMNFAFTAKLSKFTFTRFLHKLKNFFKMTNPMPRKARATLDKMTEARILTPTGKDWLIQVTDPFHDAQINTTGYPDLNSCQTIVQCFAYTYSLTNSGILPWDAHVFFNPMSYNWTNGLTPTQLQPVQYAPNGTVGPVAFAPGIYGGYNMISCNTGLNWQNSNPTAPAVNNSAVAFPSSATTGLYRLVSCGVEVVNTTPQLYRGGSVTVYRSPTIRTDSLVNIPLTTGSSPTSYSQFLTACSLPPSLQTEAQIYPSSRTWGAEEGCYLVGTLSDIENPFMAATPNEVMAIAPLTEAALSTLPATILPTTRAYINPAYGLVTGTSSSNMQLLPFDNHGAIFTGLTPQTTLQVSVKYFIERIPTFTQQDLLVLVRPPAQYDAVALEIYTKTIQELPVGVMVKENPLGEWFNDVLEAVSDYAPAVGSIFGPIGGGLGSAMAAAANASLASRRGNNSVASNVGNGNSHPTSNQNAQVNAGRNYRNQNNQRRNPAPKQRYYGPQNDPRLRGRKPQKSKPPHKTW